MAKTYQRLLADARAGKFSHVIVALSFTLARRESALLGIRVKGGLRAKRENGGFTNYAPDGYRNVVAKVTGEARKLMGH